MFRGANKRRPGCVCYLCSLASLSPGQQPHNHNATTQHKHREDAGVQLMQGHGMWKALGVRFASHPACCSVVMMLPFAAACFFSPAPPVLRTQSNAQPLDVHARAGLLHVCLCVLWPQHERERSAPRSLQCERRRPSSCLCLFADCIIINQHSPATIPPHPPSTQKQRDHAKTSPSSHGVPGHLPGPAPTGLLLPRLPPPLPPLLLPPPAAAAAPPTVQPLGHAGTQRRRWWWGFGRGLRRPTGVHATD